MRALALANFTLASTAIIFMIFGLAARAAVEMWILAIQLPFMLMLHDGNIERTYVSAGIYILFVFAFYKAFCFNADMILCQQGRHLCVDARTTDR